MDHVAKIVLNMLVLIQLESLDHSVVCGVKCFGYQRCYGVSDYGTREPYHCSLSYDVLAEEPRRAAN
jgi:hypothetical protein